MSKKHLNEIETLDDFLMFLYELCATPDSRIFYLPIYMKFRELYREYRNMWKNMMWMAFLAGMLVGSTIIYIIFIMFG